MIDFDLIERPKLFEKFGLEFRRSERHRSEEYPLLDALLPILEYKIEQLRGSGFLDAWLSAAIRAEARINEAEALLKPLGIVREDLLILLHTRMDEQYKAQKAARKRDVAGQKQIGASSHTVSAWIAGWRSTPRQCG